MALSLTYKRNKVNRHRSREREEHQVIKIFNPQKFSLYMNNMIFVNLIIFIISIDYISTKNSSSSNHFLIISSCQSNKTELESGKKFFYLIRYLTMK